MANNQDHEEFTCFCKWTSSNWTFSVKQLLYLITNQNCHVPQPMELYYCDERREHPNLIYRSAMLSCFNKKLPNLYCVLTNIMCDTSQNYKYYTKRTQLTHRGASFYRWCKVVKWNLCQRIDSRIVGLWKSDNLWQYTWTPVNDKMAFN